MKNINVTIRPVSGRCEGDCGFCAYRRGEAAMDAEILCDVVDRATADSRGDVTFTFSGGEPMLAGLDFFKDFAAIEKRMLGPAQHATHIIQTDGSLMDDNWAFFFAQHDFLVELSADGSRETHEGHRGKGSYARLKRAVELLNEQGAEVWLNCTVTEPIARRVVTVYRSMKELGADGLVFTPAAADAEGLWPLSPKRYAAFLKALFDLWWNDRERGDHVRIRLFENAMRRMSGLAAFGCALDGSCLGCFTVQGNGSVYSCSRSSCAEDCLGSITVSGFNKLFETEAGQRFYRLVRETPDECRECEFLDFCDAGCPLYRGIYEKSRYCAATRWLFEYAESRLKKAARQDFGLESL